MIKEFLMKQAVKHGTKNLPKEQAEMLQAAVEKNPKLFETIAKEIEEVKKTGKPEMYAALDVMKKYQKELQELFQK
jgi:glucosamine 6-phosphate synthetase-like amidotransferase/phosphosugar isomerase protein